MTEGIGISCTERLPNGTMEWCPWYVTKPWPKRVFILAPDVGTPPADGKFVIEVENGRAVYQLSDAGFGDFFGDLLESEYTPTNRKSD